MNLPNKLTVLRMIMVPIFVVVMMVSNSLWADLVGLFLFAAASITDMLDGKIARRHNLVTDFGKFIDPLEKCMTTAWKPLKVGNTLTHVPLPGGAAYATAARELAFVKFHSESISGNKMLYSYIFKRPDNKTLITLWSIENDVKLELDFASPVRVVNMFGRESTLSAGKNQLTASIEPIYIISDEPVQKMQQKIDALFNSISPEYQFGAKLTAPGKAMLYLTNPGNDSADFTVNGTAVKVLPGTVSQLPITINADQKNVTVKCGKKSFDVPVVSDTVKVKKLAKAPVFDGSGSWLPAEASGKLTVPENVYPREALQPERYHFKSSMNPNGHNIEAVYYLAYDQKNFYMAVKVDDPVHQQRNRNQNLWRDDCVQFVLATAPVPPESARFWGMDSKVYTQGKNYGVALTGKGTEFVRYGTVKPPEMQALVTRKGNETFYEIAVPWSEIGTQPGKTLYFDFVIFDNNKKTQINAPYFLDMAGGVAGKRDDALLPLVIWE